MSTSASVTYRGGPGCFGERSTLARALASALIERGIGLDVGMGVYEIAVDRVLEAQAAYVGEDAERAKLPRINDPRPERTDNGF